MLEWTVFSLGFFEANERANRKKPLTEKGVLDKQEDDALDESASLR
jgi:hypothetical protein